MRRRELLGGVASLAAMGLGFSYSPPAEAAPRKRTKGKGPSPAMRNAFRIAKADHWPKVARKYERVLAGIIQRLTEGQNSKAEAAWSKLIKRMGKISDADTMAIVMMVMRQSYLGSVEDLKALANKVRFFNQQKLALRDAIREAKQRRDAAKQQGKASVHRLRLGQYKPGAKAIRSRRLVSMTSRQLASYEAELRRTTRTVSADGSLSMLRLQDALQKKNRVFTMMTNMTKTMHDTAKKIIGNMKA